MRTNQRILVALAGTSHDRALIAYARRLAERGWGRRFDFLHVVDPDTGRDQSAVVRTVIETAVEKEFGPPLPGIESDWHVVPGVRIDALLRAATQLRADVILVGHRRERSGRRSLARRLAMVAPCSVWLVPEGAPATIHTVLAPVDFSDNSADALRTAVEVARTSGATALTVLHVTFDPTIVRYDEHVAEQRADEDDHLRRFLAGVDTAGVRMTALTEEGPDAARTVLRVAAERQADLIVMSTRGRSRAAAVLLGSVTARVMAESPIAVLAVKHFGAARGLFEVLCDRALWHESSAKTN